MNLKTLNLRARLPASVGAVPLLTVLLSGWAIRPLHPPKANPGETALSVSRPSSTGAEGSWAAS